MGNRYTYELFAYTMAHRYMYAVIYRYIGTQVHYKYSYLQRQWEIGTLSVVHYKGTSNRHSVSVANVLEPEHTN